MNVHTPDHLDPLAAVRLDLAARERALATNGGIFARRHLPDVDAILRARQARLALAAAQRLAESLPVARRWDPLMRRDVREVLRALATAARGAPPRSRSRAEADWLRDRLREIETQDLRVQTLAEILRVRRQTRSLFPSPRPPQRRR